MSSEEIAAGGGASVMRTAAAWVLAGLALLVPLATTNLTVFGVSGIGFTYDVLALPRLVLAATGVLLICALWFAGSALAETRQLRWDSALLALCGLVAWVGLAAAVSPDPRFSLIGQSERVEGLVAVVCYLLLYFAGMQAIRGESDLARVASGLGIAMAILSVYGVAQMVGFDPADHTLDGGTFSERLASSFLGNPNFLAGFLVLVLPLALGLAAQSRSAVGVWTWWGAAALGTAALVGTATRGAWLAAGVELVVAAIVLRRGRTRLSPHARYALAALAGVVVVTVVAGSLFAGDKSPAARLSASFQSSGSFSERSMVWGSAVRATVTRPFAGYGPDGFLRAFRINQTEQHAMVFGATSTMNNAHQWLLQFAATTGVPGALLLGTALVFGLYLGWQSARSSRAQTRPLFLAAWLGCLGYAVHMMFNVAVPGVTTPFWLLLGAVAAPTARSVPVSRAVAAAGALVSIVLLVASVIVGARMLSASSHYLRARDAFRDGDASRALIEGRTAVALDPLSVKYSRGLAQVLAESVHAMITSGASAAEVGAAYRVADEAFSATNASHPGDYVTLAWWAALQADVARSTQDFQLSRAAAETALEATRLDRDASEVRALANGDTSEQAISRARELAGLP